MANSKPAIDVELLHPVSLIIEAIKQGDLILVKLLIDKKNHLRAIAGDILKKLENLTQTKKKLQRTFRLNEEIIDCIEIAVLEEIVNEIAIDLDDLKIDIADTLQAEKQRAVAQFDRENSDLFPEFLGKKQKDFRNLLNEEFLPYPWEGYSSVSSMHSAKKRLAKSSKIIKQQLIEISREKSELKQQLKEISSQLDIENFFKIEEFVANLRKTWSLPILSAELISNLYTANVPITGTFKGDYYSLIEAALQYQQPTVLQFLLNCSDDLQKLLNKAVINKQLITIRFFLKHYDSSLKIPIELINYTYSDGSSLLYHLLQDAYQANDYSLAIELIEQGADIQSALLQLVKSQKLEEFKAFLFHIKYDMTLDKAIVNYRDKRGDFLLHLSIKNAFETNDYSLFLYLLKQGCHLFARNNNSLTPWNLFIHYQPLEHEYETDYKKCLMEVIDLMLVKKTHNCVNFFSKYQELVLNILINQRKKLQQIIACKNPTPNIGTAEEQLSIVNELLLLTAIAHGAICDDGIYKKIINLSEKYSDILHYENLGSRLLDANSFATREFGNAFRIKKESQKDSTMSSESRTTEEENFSETKELEQKIIVDHISTLIQQNYLNLRYVMPIVTKFFPQTSEEQTPSSVKPKYQTMLNQEHQDIRDYACKL